MAEHDAIPCVGLDDDDDGMPSLVDRPPLPMTFTFCTDLTPIAFSTDPTRFELVEDDAVPRICAPPPEHDLDDYAIAPAAPARGSRSKKHDASYIPRPPNAFILFRSSFIRSQQIPDKIEGNHSSLSKIIGIVWKSLPRAEREHWEAQAVKAQAEHRLRYPHWRFRPCANALAKVKDGPRKRGARKKGRGGTGAQPVDRGRETRCAKIAGLLQEGMTGTALASAVQAWDIASGGAAAAETEKEKEEKQKEREAGEMRSAGDAPQEPKARSASPVRFAVPLTAMFKRAASAPLAHARIDIPASPHHNEPVAARAPFGPFDELPPAASVHPAFGWPEQHAYPGQAPLLPSSSPPGSPYSAGTADTELCASSVGPAHPQGFLSSYSSLYGWAGDGLAEWGAPAAAFAGHTHADPFAHAQDQKHGFDARYAAPTVFAAPHAGDNGLAGAYAYQGPVGCGVGYTFA